MTKNKLQYLHGYELRRTTVIKIIITDSPCSHSGKRKQKQKQTDRVMRFCTGGRLGNHTSTTVVQSRLRRSICSACGWGGARRSCCCIRIDHLTENPIESVRTQAIKAPKRPKVVACTSIHTRTGCSCSDGPSSRGR